MTSTTSLVTRSIKGELVNPVDAYALDVVEGRIPAGRYHRLACQRHLNDRRREDTPGFPYRFVWEEYRTIYVPGPEGPVRKQKLKQCAMRFLNFARKCKHYKGKWAGQYFEPTPNQVFRLGCIFGWRHVETGHRRFTDAYQELVRKSGKSFEAAIVALYVTFFEGEPGAEGYCIATKRSQARRVFDDAKKIVKSSGLRKRIQVNASNLHREQTECKLEPLGADADSTDGLNPHCITTDEYHAHKVRDLVDVMTSATAARANPFHNKITTAGDDPTSPCADEHDFICKILDGLLDDDPSTVSTFGFIAHADPEDDWQDESTWRKASPHYGISINPEDVRKFAALAKNIPSVAAEFKQKYLNLWNNQVEGCLSIDGWRAGQSAWPGGVPAVPREAHDDLLGQECYAGVDLASKQDLCVLSLVFPPTSARPRWRLIQYIWTPIATLKDRAHRDRAPYPVWVEQGWLIPVPGTRIDHDVVRVALVEARDKYKILRLGFDPWHSDDLIRRLIRDEGFEEDQAIEVPQTYAGMSSACLRFQADCLAGDIDARGCPVTAWAITNTVGQLDGKLNLMFGKKRSKGRIDPVIAPTIGMALSIRPSDDEDDEASRDFAERGLFL